MLGIHEWVIRNAGPNVGKQAERFAHGHVEALEAAALWRGDGGLKKDFSAAQRVPGTGLDTRSIPGEVNLLADVYRFYLEVRAGFLENMQGGGHDLRADAVAVCNGDRDRLRHVEKRPFTD